MTKFCYRFIGSDQIGLVVSPSIEEAFNQVKEIQNPSYGFSIWEKNDPTKRIDRDLLRMEDTFHQIGIKRINVRKLEHVPFFQDEGNVIFSDDYLAVREKEGDVYTLEYCYQDGYYLSHI